MGTLFFLPGGGATGSVPDDTTDSLVQWGKVDEMLLAKLVELDDETQVELVLRLAEQADLEDVKFQRGEVVERLRTAADSQGYVLPALADVGFTPKNRFWIINALLVEGPAGQIGEITKLAQVQRILPNFEVSLVDGSPSSDAEATSSFTWGLARIGVDQVWSEIGVQGSGVRVCVSDTGVDISHPDLDGKMWSDAPGNPGYPGGWVEFDSSGNPVAGSTPHDTSGHGTHTSGTVLGGDASGVAIGVAPGAALMHALVLPGGGGTFAQVIAGIEWCVSPHDDEGNPAGEPAEVHSMSWGATGYSNEMVDPIRNGYFAGTVPVAATMNCGEGCSGSPGNIYDTLGIGASDESDLIASFSSGETIQKSYWGSPPADWPDMWVVPLLSAPGVNVYSSLPGGGYDYWQGTSMATPHVAGCAALMVSANPTLTPADIRDTLVATAVWFDTYYPSPPDTRYGWGRIDCLDAVETVAFNSGIAGTLRDQQDGEPVDQAYVNVSSVDVQREVLSTPEGTFRLSLKPGTYNLSAERFGYQPLSVANVTLVQDQWVNLDLDLVPLPRGNVTGTAFYNATGIGAPGVTVTVLNVPVVMTAATEGSGAYALQKVPEGTYALRAASPYLRDGTVTGVIVVAGANATVNFYLDPRDRVGVMGDQGDGLSRLARDNGYYVENPDWYDVINGAGRYRVVVVNHPFFPGTTTFNDFLSATDAAGTGVVFLDTWEHTFTGGGIYYLWNYLSDPATRGYADDWTANHLYYRVSQSHPILDPHGVGDVVILEDSTAYHDHAWFDQYSGENGTVLAQAGIDPQGDLGPGIAVDERANNCHVLLSLHGASNYIGPDDWTADGTDIFLNAVNWSKASSVPTALPVDFDLRVDPPVGLWSETFQVSIQAKNVGSATGNYTARLYVDGWLEATQTVSLTSGETQAVAFNVARDPVSTYAVTIGPHATTFRIRAPRVTVQAEDVDGSPLAGSRVAVGLGSAVLEMGITGPNGSTSFDSPSGSHGLYWIVLQAYDVGTGGMQYFLTQEVFVEDDIVVAYQPTTNATATLNLQMESVAAGQQATIYLRRDAMPESLGD
ncbi:MAG: S8 family serine peptidase, partial [bacterium]